MASRRRISYSITPRRKVSQVDTPGGDAEAWFREGNALIAEGRPDAAIAVYDRLLALQPAHAAAHINRGIALGLLGRHDEALVSYDHALRLQPQRADAHANRGVALSALQQPEQALLSLDRAIRLQPAHADAWNNRGNTLRALGKLNDALASYERAIKIRPDHADAHGNRGFVLHALGNLPAALASYERAIALRPGHADTHTNRSNLLNDLGRYDEAAAGYERALTLAPDQPMALYNRGIGRLLAGQFAAGWRDYAARMAWWAEQAAGGRHSGPVRWLPGHFDKPLWDGGTQPITLLVWEEQGLGDQIMYSSMLREARARVSRLILATEPRLHALFQRSFPDCELTTCAAAAKAGSYDAQIPLGHLGALLRNKEEDFLRHRRAFLSADPARKAELREIINPGHRRVCGVSWRSINNEIGAQKSMGLAALQPLLQMPGFRFVDLQYGDTSAERATLRASTGLDMLHLDEVDAWHDMEGLAALIDACDVVVTISNTTAHIAGALGKEVWLMLPHAAGRLWYWQIGRDDALWYPQMRLIRQHTPGDWSAVIGHVTRSIMHRN